jgi:multiple antibiotic resistance protein
MAEVAVTAFVTLFVVLDPLGNLPIFMALTRGESAAHRRWMAIKGTLIAGVVLLLFAVVGSQLLGWMGIGLPAFRAAGGLMLMVIAFEMVFEKRNPRRSETAGKIASEAEARDISVFPIAIPLIAGPGSITSILLLVGNHAEQPALQGLVLADMVLVLLVSLLLFLLAAPIERLVGETVIAVISRLLGILLAALSVQYVFDGLKEGLLS